jgi:hypothetical protein
LDFKRNFYGQFPSKICKNSKTLTGAGIPAGQKFSTGTGPDRAWPAVYRYRFHLWVHMQIKKCHSMWILVAMRTLVEHLVWYEKTEMIEKGGNGRFLGFRIPKNPMKIRKIPRVRNPPFPLKKLILVSLSMKRIKGETADFVLPRFSEFSLDY